ncbi:hypothetical protein [Niallia taxi]|uniref:hypothetical protein n=1 Tax=Niallia taxi TaxID=2499688 RepID=UPI00300B22B7
MNMRAKKLLVVGGTLLTLAGVAVVGQVGGNSEAEASGTWVNDQLAANNKTIANAGYEKKEEIIKSSDEDIKNTINGKLDGKVKTAEEELQEMLDQYYQMKLDGLEDSEEYKYLEQQIAITKKSIYDRYVKEVDAIFAGKGQ